MRNDKNSLPRCRHTRVLSSASLSRDGQKLSTAFGDGAAARPQGSRVPHNRCRWCSPPSKASQPCPSDEPATWPESGYEERAQQTGCQTDRSATVCARPPSQLLDAVRAAKRGAIAPMVARFRSTRLTQAPRASWLPQFEANGLRFPSTRLDDGVAALSRLDQPPRGREDARGRGS